MTETREQKAQRLVDEGRVALLGSFSWGAEAMVIGDHSNYATTFFNSGHYECTCEHGRFHSHTDDLCAHALAVRLLTQKENKPCQP